MTTPATPNVFVGSTDDTSEGGLFVSTSSTNLATEAPETSNGATIATPDSFTGSTDNAADGSLFTDVNVSSVADIKITKIIAGTGLVGTSLDGPVPTLNVIGGTGITANADDISIDNTVVTLVGTQTLTNKTIDADNNTILNIEVDNFKGTAIVTETEGIGSNDNDTSLPTSAAVKDYVDTQVTAQDLDFQADTGGALSIDLDSEVLTFTGGTGIDTSGSGNAVTFAIDSTVATLSGTQTLSNKTLTTPIISTISNTGSLTLPTSTDTLVGRNTTDTLTNKTIDIANNTITIASTDLSDASSIDAATLDSIDSTSFLRSDVADTKTAGDLSFDDNVKAVFGTGNDLTIHHEPGFSIIREQNANAIFIQTDNTQYGVSITKKFGTEAMARFIPDGEVTLYHNNVAKFSTAATGVNVTGALTVSGDLTVNGTTTTIDTQTLSVEDPLIILANNNNSTDLVDIGFYGLYDTSGAQDLYAGLFRDASDDKFKLFKSLQTEPTNTVDTSGTGYTVATLVADLEGNVTGNLTGDVTGAVTTKTSTGGVLKLQTSGTSVLEDDDLGFIRFYAPDTTYGAPNSPSYKAFDIIAKATRDFSLFETPTKLSFKTRNDPYDGSTQNLAEIFSVNPDGSISLPYDAKKIRFHTYVDTPSGTDFDESFIVLGNNNGFIRNSGSPLTDLTYNIFYEADRHYFRTETGGGATPTYQTAMSIQNQTNAGVHSPLYIKTDSAYPVWIEDAGTGTGNLYLGSSFVTSNRVDTTATELNMLDGSSKSTTSITIDDADAFIVIDDTTTKQIPASDISSYVKGTGTTTPVKEAGLETIWIPASNMTPFDTEGFTLERINTSGNANPQLEAFKIDSTTVPANRFAEFSIAMPKSWNRSSFTAEHYFYNKSGSTWTVSNLYIRAANWRSGSTVTSFPSASNITNTSITNNTVVAISSGTFSAAGSTNVDGTNLVMFQIYKTNTGIGSAEYYYFGTKIFFTTNAKNDN